jgi:DNA-binding PadR family transcriptional regulator
VKLYHLTKAGRARLRRERAQWRSYVVAMELVLEGA